MKIAFISPQIPPGGQNGIGVATLHLALGLCELGCSVDIYTWLDDPLSPIVSYPDLKIIRIPNKREINTLEYYLGRIINRIIRILTFSRKNVTSISIRDIRGALTMYLYRMDKKLNQYDIVESCEWGGGSTIFKKMYGNTLKITKLHASLYSHVHTYLPYINFSKLDVKISSLLERSGINNSDLIISPSKSTAEEAHKWLNITNEIKILPNSINLTYVNYQLLLMEKHNQNDVVKILFIGRVDELKGVKVLDDIVRLLRQKNGNWELSIIGNIGVNEIDYPNLFIEAPKNVKINWLGEQRNDQVYRFLSLSDIFLFPSHTENCPMVVLEAMASGLPVIASSVGGIPEIISSGVDGVLCTSSDPFAFCEAIISLSDPHLRESIGKNAHLKIERCFSSKVIAQKWLDLCMDKISNRNLAN